MPRLIFLILLPFSCLDAKKVNSADAPVGKVHIYKNKGDIAREIEIFFPKDHAPETKAVPGIIMFHGGGWGGGHRKQFRYLCHYFSTRGLVAATVTYKLAAKAGVKNNVKGTESRKRVCITDAKSAIRWYKENAKKLGIDPKTVIDVFNSGNARSYISQSRFPNHILSEKWDARSRVSNLHKDLSMVTDLLNDNQIGCPYGELTTSILQNAISGGLADIDFSLLFNEYEKLISD